jgi:DNA polymerase
MDRQQKQQALDEVAKQIAKTEGGPLKADGINPVPGEGNPETEVLFIGEAPGFNENQSGRPFVGQAGKLLRKNLAANGWKDEDVFITNIVKFRPPENRDPTPEEIEFFKPFLDEQIKIIDPKIIVTLGRFSMYKFFGEGVSISRIHGMPREVTFQGKKITIFPMYHPAAALRQGSVMRDFEADFRKLKEFAQKMDSVNSDLIDANANKTKSEVKQLELV